MKKHFKFLSLAFIASLTAVSFASCSDDDDEPSNGGGEQPGVVAPKPSEVFTAGIPSQVGDLKITTNEKGQVTKIENDGEVVTFTYGTISRAETYDMTMRIVDTENSGDPADDLTFYMRLNKDGFVTYALEVDGDGNEDTWEFGYNADKQLNYMKRSEGNNEVTNITYVNGDITKVDMKSDPDEYGYIDEGHWTISYTSENVKSPVANKGGIMLFDLTFGIDMDEFDVAYFAGLLGKSTKNLPVVRNEEDFESENYAWTLNAAGLPTKMVATTEYSWGAETDEITFVW